MESSSMSNSSVCFSFFRIKVDTNIFSKMGQPRENFDAVWSICAAPGAPLLSFDGFCLFLHVLSFVRHGGAVPPSVTPEQIAHMLNKTDPQLAVIDGGVRRFDFHPAHPPPPA
jgi:hypothetical protein